MDETRTYQIKIHGLADDQDLNANSPIQMMGMQVETGETRFTVHTDQSGLIGLLRHLHNRGLALVSVQTSNP